MPTTKRQFAAALVEEVQPVARRAVGPYRGVTALSITGSGATIVLTAAQAQNSIIVLSGAMRAGGAQLVFANPGPGGNGIWHVDYTGVTGLGSDNALSFAVGTGAFGGLVNGSQTSTLAIVVARGANIAPSVLIGV